MKHFNHKACLTTMLAALMICCLAAFACAEGAETEEPAYRTDVTEADFSGTWSLKNMVLQGYTVPTETLGIHATIVITEGQIEITDVLEVTKTYEAAFEENKLVFLMGEEQMFVYITEDGLLHLEQEAKVFDGTEEPENPEEKKTTVFMGATGIDMGSLNDSFLTQYFVKVEE